MSPVTWTKVERGEKVTPSTYAGVERSLLWSRGSIELFFNTGNLPEQVEAQQPGVEVPVDTTTLEDLELIDELQVPATTKLALMRQYLRYTREARNEIRDEVRRHAG